MKNGGGRSSSKPSFISEKTRILEYRVTLSDTSFGNEIWIKLLYGKLSELHVYKNKRELQRDLRKYDPINAAELPETYDIGSRLYCSAETFIDALGCSISSGWQIIEVK